MPNQAKPTFLLALLRHANAQWPKPAERDYDRALDENGIAQAAKVSAYILRSNFYPNITISSPAKRCSQTIDIVNAAFDDQLSVTFDPSLYNSPVEEYLSAIAKVNDGSDILIVGHNPTLEDLSARLLGFDVVAQQLSQGFNTAGFLLTEVSTDPQTGELSADFIDYFEP